MRPQQGLPDYLSLKIQTPFPPASRHWGGCIQTAFPSPICTQGQVFRGSGLWTPFKNKCQRPFPAALRSVAVLYQKGKRPHTHPTPTDICLLQGVWWAAQCLLPSLAISEASLLSPYPLLEAQLPPRGFLPCGLLRLSGIKHISYSSLLLRDIQ